MRLPLPIIVALALLAVPCSASRAGDESQSPDEQLLRNAGLGVDTPTLLDFFRQRARLGVPADELNGLLHALTQGAPAARENAVAAIIARGPTALPLVRAALKDLDDVASAEAAQRCLQAIEDPGLPAAAARLLAERKADGAADVLLAYLPYAESTSLLQEIEQALSRLAIRDGKANPALLAALRDPTPVRRIAAAVALCPAEGPAQTEPVLRLLRDPKPTVRLRVALALAAVSDRDAIPVLIALLGELPENRAKEADEMLRGFAGNRSPALSIAGEESSREKCRDAWAQWWREVNDEALMAFFRTRTLTEQDRARLQRLVRQLGDDAFDVREKAAAELRGAGVLALPYLRQAALSADAEVKDRANECLKQLDAAADSTSAAINARLLAVRKPQGAAEALFRYLPFVEDAATRTAVEEALLRLAVHDGRPAPVLVQGLRDPSPELRAAAGVALWRAGVGGETGVAGLLSDPDPSVRLRLALTLVTGGERAAVPVLIALLRDLPAAQTWRVEEILQRLAGDSGPVTTGGVDKAGRLKRRAAWAEWWRQHAAGVDLSRLVRVERVLGYTLLVQFDPNGRTGRVVELGRNSKVRWEIAGLQYPTDAQVLPGNRVLVAEHYGMRVTERDLKGNILWQYRIAMPINCQRLANGNTFIASRNLLVEVDRNQNELFKFTRSGHDIMAARRMPDGRIYCLTRVGQCIEYDRTGRQVKTFAVGQSLLGALDVLANGHVLVPNYSTNRVTEYDEEGRENWRANVAMPNSARRLPSGQTIVASQTTQQVALLDRAGKIIWEYKADGRPWQVWQR
jgi:HEAT repeat protein